MGRDMGLVDDARWSVFEQRRAATHALREYLSQHKHEGIPLIDYVKRPNVDADWLLANLNGAPLPAMSRDKRLVATLLADIQYSGYIDRQHREVAKLQRQESTSLPTDFDSARVDGLRREAQQTLNRFRPATFGQAGRLAGITPADLMLVSVAMGR